MPASTLPRALLDWSAFVRIGLAQAAPDTGLRLDGVALMAFEQALSRDLLYASPPFCLETLYSARTPADFALLTERLASLRQAEGDATTWSIAARAQRELAEDPAVSHRISIIDLLVASIASQQGLGVLHYDADYDLLAEHTSLEFESVWIAPAGSVD